MITSLMERAMRALHVEEVAGSRTLTIAAWILLFGWYLEFATWFRYADFTTNAVAEGRHLCWPFFQGCGDWYFLSQFPYANTHGLWYAILFGLLIYGAYLLIERRYMHVQLLLVAFFVWELVVLMMSMRLAVNYWYYHVFYAAIFLFAAQKLAYLRVAAVLLYFMSGILKLHESWLAGSYFTALEEGLYFIPDPLIPLATNAVILMEIVLVWFLFSRHARVRRGVLAILTVFHMYSVIYVGYGYPTVALPMVLLLFGLEDVKRPTLTQLQSSRVGILLIALFFAIHAVPWMIEGRARETGEGNKFGMYMFDTNYQCVSRAVIRTENGEEREEVSRSREPNHRCDPYAYWFHIKHAYCRADDVARVEWTHDVSYNGAPLRRIVDTDDACALTYAPFRHNPWIARVGTDEAPIVAPVERNRYPVPGF